MKNHQCHMDYTAKEHQNFESVATLQKKVLVTYTFSRTMPLACDAPANGLDFQRVPK